MKINEVKKEEPMVEKLIKIREAIGIEIQDLTYEELQKYAAEHSTIQPKEVWKKVSKE